jgi:enoyl-CoA hydratase
MYDLPEELTVEAEGPIRIVTLNRPEALNALNPTLHHALVDVWGRMGRDKEARVVILTGAGRAFSAGGDVENFLRNQEDLMHRRQSIRGARQLVDAMIGFHLPVVAAVNGPAVGLGCSLAIMSDFVVMSDTAYFSDPHVKVGLVAGDGGAAFWPYMMGMLKAKELVMLGDRVPADEAVRLGLANKAVSADQLMSEAMAIAQRFSELSPVALQDTKRAFNLHLRRAVEDVMHFALAAESESFDTPFVRESVERIRNKS